MAKLQRYLNSELAFISDSRLKTIIKDLVSKMQSVVEKDASSIYKNVIDPFSACFDSMRQGLTLTQWLEQEKSRQAQKTLQNYIGEFHQAILGQINDWENLKVGNSIDLRSRSKKVIAELKNKYNTMNSSSALAIYDKLQRHLDYDESYRGYTAYCVIIIPKSPRPLNTIFNPSERGTKRPLRQDIRVIDGKSFYALATGDPNALEKLYIKIGLILSKIYNISTDQLLSENIFFDLFNRAYSFNKDL